VVIGDITLLSSAETGGQAALELAATLYLPSLPSRGKAPGLVVGHGAGSCRGNHDEFSRLACASGFVVVALDFRGHGDSAGRTDGPLEHDVLAAARHLRSLLFVDAEQICYRGSSMGGFYGLKAAVQGAFAALVLLCPAGEKVILEAIDERETAESAAGGTAGSDEGERPLWDIGALRGYFGTQNSLRLASRISAPVLLVHARGDDVVPFEHSLRLTQALGGPATLVALPGGSHTSAQHDQEIHRRTLDWLRSTLAWQQGRDRAT
jgi:dipeptidyl aminopeptidase/acylaminoacyl peptidase